MSINTVKINRRESITSSIISVCANLPEFSSITKKYGKTALNVPRKSTLSTFPNPQSRLYKNTKTPFFYEKLTISIWHSSEQNDKQQSCIACIRLT